MAEKALDTKKIATLLYEESKQQSTLYGEEIAQSPQVTTLNTLRAVNVLLSLLLSTGSTRAIKQVVQEYETLVQKDLPTQVALVKSVVELQADQLKEIGVQLEKLLHKKLILKNEIDPAITGGLVIEVGDQVIDLSISGGLEKIKQQIKQANSNG